MEGSLGLINRDGTEGGQEAQPYIELNTCTFTSIETLIVL
jgi:hypothetical protein